MKLKPLSTVRIACHNLRAKEGRTACLAAIVAIMAFVFFGGSVISRSLENGITSLEARFGADITILPFGSKGYYENIIFSGPPVNFYFDKNIAQEIAAVAGVQQVTAQFFIATLEATCCAAEVQIVGIDYDTDFVIMPWISRFHQRQIGADEIIAGSNIVFDRSNTITFFNQNINVAAQLARTATGIDNTAFVNMDTARRLARAAMAAGHAGGFADIDNAASAVLVRVIPGYDVSEVAQNIRNAVYGIDVLENSSVHSRISANLSFFTGIINAVTIALCVLSVFILALLFWLIANGRKKEFAVIRILGATRKKLADIVLAEAFAVSLSGAVIGVLLALIVVFPFGLHIGRQMGMPLLLPGTLDSFLLLLFGITAAAATGPLSAAYSAYKISRAETYATMREGE